MNKKILLLLTIICFTSCSDSNSDVGSFTLVDLPVDSYILPESFIFGEQYNITVTYTLPDGCHSFNNLFYEIKDTSRIIAIRAFVDLDRECTTAVFTEEHLFVEEITQEEDYVFKFFKGQDNDGENIFEEVTVPVN